MVKFSYEEKKKRVSILNLNKWFTWKLSGGAKHVYTTDTQNNTKYFQLEYYMSLHVYTDTL